MIKKYEEGDIRAEWKNNIDGYKVDYSDLHGFSLFAFLQSPSEEDISKMSKDADIVIYFDDMDGVGFFTFSFDGTGGSAAFAPSLNLDYPKFNIPDGLSGFPFNIYVIDSTSGKIKALRSITLSSEFSKWLSDWCRQNEILNLSLDHVKDISKKYFAYLKKHDKKRAFRIAFNTTKKCIEHAHDTGGR